ncbi:MAG: type II secretion system protein [Armatimonadetes bacterium]|nr:type II secretion system protein [Armatimonadota bacterium]
MSRRAGFSLIELLVVIAIMSVLAGILFPVFAAAHEKARQIVCTSQLRQIGMALRMYQQDYEEYPPHLSTLFPNYIATADIFLCPNDPNRGQREGNNWAEGNLYLASGVSYDYTPNWAIAQSLNWWNPRPRYGSGKWEDLTPIADCAWHWATRFIKEGTWNHQGARGWVFVLTAGGSVRRLRAEMPIAEFTPERYF